MDKVVLKFICDVLYIKGIMTIKEYEATMDCCTPDDLDDVFEKIMREEFIIYGRNNEE